MLKLNPDTLKIAFATRTAVNDQRPDPDVLLNRIQRQEEKSRRGRLKVFFGAAAGVGKTYAMLAEAQERSAGSQAPAWEPGP